MPNSRNLDRFLKPDVKLSSNGFPLERRDVFSSKVGLLNLAFCLPTIPNDYHELDPTVYIQTDRFNVANFTRMSQHLDFFYVPMTAIQSRWNEWYQQTQDPANAIFDMHPIVAEQQDDFVPYINLQYLVISLCKANCYYNIDKIQAFREAFPDATETDFGLTLLDNYADHSHYDSVYDKLFTMPDPQDQSQTIPVWDKLGYPVFLNTIRLLDMAGYGNLLPVVNLPLFTFNVEAFDSDSDIHKSAQDFATLMDSIDKHVNLYALAAYQCVCHNYFTNPHFERPSVVAYNFDDLDSGDFVNLRYISGQSSHPEYYRSLFTMNYTPWKKDIFLSALPSPQFGDVSVVTVLSDHLIRPNGSSISSYYGLEGNSRGFRLSTGTPVEFVGNFSTLDMVKANALQYWKQQIGRAGYRTSDRFKATFGNAPRNNVQILPQPIGSVYSNINKTQIVGSSGDDFGEKRANGESLIQNQKIKFKSPNEFGYIIGIHRILPEADYDAYGIDKHHTKFDPFDFFTPAFQNLGLEALDVSELSIYNEAFYYNSTDVLGYVPRYHEYKTSIDKVHGEFCNMPMSLMKHLDFHNPNLHSGLSLPNVGAFSSFVSSRIDMESYIGSIRQYYVDPAVVDNLFVQSADGEQKTDQFWITCYIDVKSYRSMSVLGLPQF